MPINFSASGIKQFFSSLVTGKQKVDAAKKTDIGKLGKDPLSVLTPGSASKGSRSKLKSRKFSLCVLELKQGMRSIKQISPSKVKQASQQEPFSPLGKTSSLGPPRIASPWKKGFKLGKGIQKGSKVSKRQSSHSKTHSKVNRLFRSRSGKLRNPQTARKTRRVLQKIFQRQWQRLNIAKKRSQANRARWRNFFKNRRRDKELKAEDIKARREDKREVKIDKKEIYEQYWGEEEGRKKSGHD